MSKSISVGYLDVHQFKCLWTLFPDDPKLTIAALDHALSGADLKYRNKKGISGDGRHVTTDRVGTYSSGYILLENSGDNGYVEWPRDETFTWDDDPEEDRRAEIRQKLLELRKLYEKEV